MTDFVLKIDDSLATISMSGHPLNTLTPEALASFRQRLHMVAADSRVKVVLLKSDAEQVFSTGMDPKFGLSQDQAGRERLFAELMGLLDDYDRFSIPIVTDINGPALAGGAVLAMMSQFSIAHGERAKLCFSEVKVNLPVPAPIFQLLRRRVPQPIVNDMILLGKNLGPAELELSGAVSALYYDDEQREAVLKQLIGRILRLDKAVLSRTLATAKQEIPLRIDRFLEVADKEFHPYLSDSYLVKGLNDVLGRM